MSDARKPDWVFWLSRPEWTSSEIECLGDDVEPPGPPYPRPSPRASAARKWVEERVAALPVRPIRNDPRSIFVVMPSIVANYPRDPILKALKDDPPPGIFTDLLEYLGGLNASPAARSPVAAKVYEDDRRDQTWRALLATTSPEAIFTRRAKEEWRRMLEGFSRETAGLFTEASFNKWWSKRDPLLDVPLNRTGRRNPT